MPLASLQSACRPSGPRMLWPELSSGSDRDRPNSHCSEAAQEFEARLMEGFLCFCYVPLQPCLDCSDYSDVTCTQRSHLCNNPRQPSFPLHKIFTPFGSYL